MIAPDDDRCAHLALRDELVECEPCLVALAVAEPADASRQALERDALLRHGDPTAQVVVLGEEFEDRAVGAVDVLGITGERDPAEWALALAEQRADVCGDEPGEREGAVVAALACLVADRISVIEDLGAGVHEPDHRLDMLRHRLLGPVGELLGLAVGVLAGLGDIEALGHVVERIMGGGLVGDNVGRHAPAQELGDDRGGIAHDAD